MGRDHWRILGYQRDACVRRRAHGTCDSRLRPDRRARAGPRRKGRGSDGWRGGHPALVPAQAGQMDRPPPETRLRRPADRPVHARRLRQSAHRLRPVPARQPVQGRAGRGLRLRAGDAGLRDGLLGAGAGVHGLRGDLPRIIQDVERGAAPAGLGQIRGDDRRRVPAPRGLPAHRGRAGHAQRRAHRGGADQRRPGLRDPGGEHREGDG